MVELGVATGWAPTGWDEDERTLWTALEVLEERARRSKPKG